MDTDYYSPRSEALKPFFGLQSRIDSREKAFAFILGVLIGALLHCRSHHDSKNESRLFPLSQLLSITGEDLKPLYYKVMGELDDVPENARAKVKGMWKEARHLLASFSCQIELDEVTTTYFILYGISVSASICYHPCKLEGMRHA
jgi:CRISPR-associated protein Csh1